MIKRLYCILGLLLFSGIPVSGQFFSWGQDPASLRWQQINTSNFQLIFPESYALQAADLANFLEHHYGPVSSSLGKSPRRVPVIIHNQTVVANGFVSWAPARMELFTNPPPDNDASDWMKRLAIHEFRHVVQIDALNQGVTGLLSKVFGEWVTGVSVGLFLPMWLMEGDAVVSETAFTISGRGRQPHFEQGLRAQVLEKKIYSFEKARFGSYRDYIPNYYELGYQLVASARAEYGKDIWSKVINNIARKPYTIFPLPLGMKKYAGIKPSGHYRKSMEQLKETWQLQYEKHDYTPFEPLTKANDYHTHYQYPSLLDDSTLIVLKRGMDQLPQVISIDSKGGEHLLFRPGTMTSGVVSAGNGLLAWSEQRKDPRWEHRSWAEIYTFDLNSRSLSRLTSKTRYFSPDVSADGNKIAAINVTEQNRYSIVLLDAGSGDVIRELVLPGNDFLMSPSWHPDGDHLIAMALDDTGKRIIRLDMDGNGVTTLFHAGGTDISRPRYLSDGQIVFNAAFSGIDNIYVLNIPEGEAKQLVSGRFGALDAVLLGGKLVWSDYTSDGYRLVMAESGKAGLISLERVQDFSPRFHELLAEQEGGPVGRDDSRQLKFVTEPYSKFANLFNFHSWGPFSLDVNNMSGQPGLSVFSQNALSTSVLSMGYAFDINEELGKYFINYSYSGLFPVIDILAESGLRRSFYRSEQEGAVPFLWRENSAKLGISAPLSSSCGTFFWGLQPGVRAGLIEVARSSDTPAFFRGNTIRTLEYRMFAYRQQRMPQRALKPRIGQILDLNYRHTPLGGADMGWTASARLMQYVPGLARHHSLRLSAAWQYFERGTPLEQTINYNFPVMINYPRGVHNRKDDQVVSLSADYTLPLLHPDWNIPSLLFIKRIYANLFTDYAYTWRVDNPENDATEVEEELYTLGIDLLGNMHLLGIFTPLEIGLRSIYHPMEKDFSFQLLFSISIY
jgi:hypothetical protein